jgi:predicted ATPase
MFVGEVLEHAICLEDTLRGHAAKIYALGSSGHVEEAIAYGLEILKDLGERFPRRPNLVRIYFEMQKIRRRVKRRSSESLLRLHFMEDVRKLAAMRILDLMFLNTVLHYRELTPLIGFRMVALTLDYGLSATSCLGFVSLGALLCG